MDAILDAEWGEELLQDERKELLEELINLKKKGLYDLSKKYGISQDSILNLIAREYYARTGNYGINY